MSRFFCYTKKCLTSFFLTAGHPIHLAILRFVVFASLGVESIYHNPVEYALLPAELRIAPYGLPEQICDWLPREAPVLNILFQAHLLLCFLAAVGAFTRITTFFATISSLYFLGVVHLYDLPNYMLYHHHHLIWFATILSISRCSDAFSIDNWTNRRKPLAPTVLYELPRRMIWVLIGMIYFFPGLWKALQWRDWIFGSKLRHILEWRLFASGYEASPLSGLPDIYFQIASGIVICFELMFLIFVFSRRLRMLAVFSGLTFHLTNWLLLHLSFWPLIVCYTAFLELPGTGTNQRPNHPLKIPKNLIWVGILLAAVVGICGMQKIDSWPFAVYPTFERNYLPSLEITAPFNPSTEEIVLSAPSPYQRVRWIRLLEFIAHTQDAELKTRLKTGAALLLKKNGLIPNYATSVDWQKIRIILNPSPKTIKVESERAS
jgi:hypothetical protein